jgi:hypothetical protein
MGSTPGKASIHVQRNPATPAIQGFLDLVDSKQIAGWVWDQDHPESSIQIEVHDGENRVTTATASLFRKDLVDAGIGTGAHGFSIMNPVRPDGNTHVIHVLISGTNIELQGSPKSLLQQR